ncbi:hypothetical protein NST83_06155 [Paenibacillus sp. FSL R10-2782]|uniref:hypothetical protein n=1 Tax=Paenibacillus sp. FSL R10-2782 TaxID=2954661 RepID=UPI0031588136
MNVLKGADVDLWGTVGGNKLLLLLTMIIALVLMFKVFFRPFNRKTVISALGILALIGIWVTFFLD